MDAQKQSIDDEKIRNKSPKDDTEETSNDMRTYDEHFFASKSYSLNEWGITDPSALEITGLDTESSSSADVLNSTAESNIFMQCSDLKPNNFYVFSSMPLDLVMTSTDDQSPDPDSGITSGVASCEDVPQLSTDDQDTIDNVANKVLYDGTKRKVSLSMQAEAVLRSIEKWNSPPLSKERPSTLQLDNYRDLSFDEVEKYERMSNMSPSYYTLTPSDDLSLDGLDTPVSPDESLDEVFCKILGPKLSQPRATLGDNLGAIATINVATPEVVALAVQTNLANGKNEANKRLIRAENGVMTFGAIEFGSHNSVDEAGHARLEMVVDHPLRSYSDLSYHDDCISMDADNHQVGFSSNASLHYNSDIVPLEEIYTRDFQPQDLKNGQHVASVYPRECHSWTGANLSPESMPVQLIHLEVSDQDYSTALKWLSKDVKIAYHTILYNKWLQVGVFSIFFVALWMLGYLFWHTGGLPDRIGIGLFFMLAWVLMVIGLIVCRLVRNVLNNKTEKTLAAVNDLLIRYNIIMGLEDKGVRACNRLILHFVFFNEGPCVERVLDNLNKGLQKHRTTTKPVATSRKQDPCPEIDIDESDLIMKRDMTDGQRQDLAKRLMLKYSSIYVKRLMMEQMPRPSEPRHSGNIPCLCQFVERHYFKIYEVMSMI